MIELLLMKTILLIRHGENDSLGKYLPGQLPGIHLNDAGIAQAKAIAESLGNIPIKEIISSPLERAIETAFPLAKKLGLTPRPEPGFIEMNTGSWTGLHFPEIKKDPHWENLRSEPENHTFPGGESFVDASARLWNTLSRVVSGQSDETTIAVFSHSDCIKMLLARALDMPLKRYYSFSVDTCSLSILTFHKDRIYISGQNFGLPYQWQPKAKPDLKQEIKSN
jgi:probable phosphoglycerate mutase